jgi:nucleoside-diphosphate-sugar epimerase
MEKPVIVITGAIGAAGSRTAENLLQKKRNIRAIGRSA